MNKTELFFYNLVKKNPRLKRKIRDIYQGIFDFLPKKRTESAYPVAVREGFFFGFHDKCPWSVDNKMLLAHHFKIPLRMPEPEDGVDLGYFSGRNYEKFNFLAKTRAWNWHQGSQLQWLGRSESVVFNDFDGEKHVAKIVDINGKVLQKLPLPLAALSPSGRKALSYDFARLRSSPHGYGYANGRDPEEKNLIPSKHGLSVVDVPSGYSKVLFTVAQIAAIASEDSMSGAFHYFTHCQFSPSGHRFVFFHRWLKNNNEQWTRMISCNLEGGELFIFPSDGMVSHVGWRDQEHILAWARTKRYGDGYYLFRDRTGEFSLVGRESFSSDGHPSFSKDRRWFVTDTYPDRLRQRYLILYDMEKRKHYNIARFHSPREYAGRRFEDLYMCDLHPRWDREGAMLCFDSAHTGKRALCTIFLEGLDTIKTID